MKSLSATKYNPIKVLNNSFNTPDKKLHKSRLNTQSSLKLSGDMMSVQSYLYEQAHLKEEASKKEIIRLIRQVIDTLEKNKDIQELNQQLSKLMVGLRTCINQQEVSSYIIQLIQMIREITNNNQFQKQIDFDNEKAQLIEKIHELELQAKENKHQYELKLRDKETNIKIKQYEEYLEKLKSEKQQQQKQTIQCDKKKEYNSAEKVELKNQIKQMQIKIQTLSEKEKKLIQLVKAVKSRGIDVEHIYKNINQVSSRNSRITKDESQVEWVDNSDSDMADISQFDIGLCSIKRNQKFLLD